MSSSLFGCRLCRSCARSLSLLPGSPRSSAPLERSSRRYSIDVARSGRRGRPLRMAVVGSGPAGFYTAYRVMTRVQDARVDMYEALPVPFGLVRFGVAPDHPEVKNCQDKFEEVARSPHFTFLGNTAVGSSHAPRPDGLAVPLDAVLRHYDAVVLAYGSSRDRRLGIPGEDDLRGVYSAREFVGWYNGLPECAGLAPDLEAGEDAVVVGQGNVALDVARMLLERVDVLRRTDIAAHALEALARSRIKRVHIVGRRGPMQAAFTTKEIRELMKLPDVAFHPIDPSLIPEDRSQLPRPAKRLTDILLKGSAAPLDGAAKSWSLDFCLSPVAFESDRDDGDHPSSSSAAATPRHVAATVFERTRLAPSPFDPAAVATGTGETTRLPSSAVFRSIGYRAAALAGMDELGVPFDASRGVVGNDGAAGRVLRAQSHLRLADGSLAAEKGTFPGLYCAGWVKRGPTGVIASTMTDAFATGDAIADDWVAGAPFLAEAGIGAEDAPSGWEGVRSEMGSSLRQAAAPVVSWEGWRRIDRAERERGKAAGKEREKLTSTADMLAVASP